MAVATEAERDAVTIATETLDANLETKSLIVSTSPRPFNPFGL